MKINTIYQGDSLEILKDFKDESIDCCVTSESSELIGKYYYSEQYGVYKVVNFTEHDDEFRIIVCDKGVISNQVWRAEDIVVNKPAAAEQIALFKRAEHFASKGRKLDEFRVGDVVKLERSNAVLTIESITSKYISGKDPVNNSDTSIAIGSNIIIIKTAEELEGV